MTEPESIPEINESAKTWDEISSQETADERAEALLRELEQGK